MALLLRSLSFFRFCFFFARSLFHSYEFHLPIQPIMRTTASTSSSSTRYAIQRIRCRVYRSVFGEEQYRSAGEGRVHRHIRCTGTHCWTPCECVGPTGQLLRPAPATGAPNITTASSRVAAASMAFVYTAKEPFWGGVTRQRRYHEQRSAVYVNQRSRRRALPRHSVYTCSQRRVHGAPHNLDPPIYTAAIFIDDCRHDRDSRIVV